MPDVEFRSSLLELIERDEVLMAPGIYDGLSARIAASLGFDAFYLSGFSVAGTAFGVPDIGLVTGTEVESAIGRIVDQLSGRPLIVDADNGYGGPANVERTVRRFERFGVACIQLEDQVSPKRCGHMDGKEIVSMDEAVQRIRTAALARASRDTLIMARTDAIATDGLDEALRRGEKFIDAGADILFIEAPRTIEELEKIAQSFQGTPLVINLVPGGKTPVLSPSEISELGFAIALYPVNAILGVARTLQQVYESMTHGKDLDPDARLSFEELNELLGLSEFQDRFDQ
jgi:2-methylisocitrate lyase-like PEP mutase family enzyme